MSDVKAFRIEGNYTKHFQKYIFRKEKRALKKEQAIEQVLSEVSSVGIFRRKIHITNCVELKKEEVKDPAISQLMN
jgi:ribosomal protein L20A (L18A)